MADDRLRHALDEAERLAWDSLANQNFLMFGHYATRWVSINRDGRYKRPNPFTPLIKIAHRHQRREGSMTRYITLPAINKSVPLSAYVKAIKTAKANPTMEFKTGLTCWWPCTGTEVMRQFYDGMTDRINQGIPYTQRGTA